MTKTNVIAAIALLSLYSARGASAQLLIQQPVVQQFGVQTSVIVPDRGRLVLGGISSAAESRFWPGPCGCRGSSLGRSFGYTSLSVGVWIHDLRAMNEQILAEASAAERHEPELRGRAGAAFRWFAQHRDAGAEARRASDAAASDVARQVRLNDPERALQLGRNAEAAGQLGVAKLHYQMAARLGSAEAGAKLAQLSSHTTKQQ